HVMSLALILPPRIIPPPRSILFPYTTLFRSCLNNGFPNPCMCPVDLDCAELGEQGPPLGWFQRTETNLVEYPLPEAGSITLWSEDRKSTRLNSSHVKISYAVFCLKKKKNMSH